MKSFKRKELKRKNRIRVVGQINKNVEKNSYCSIINVNTDKYKGACCSRLRVNLVVQTFKPDLDNANVGKREFDAYLVVSIFFI